MGRGLPAPSLRPWHAMALILIAPGAVPAGEPLSRRIDRAIEAKLDGAGAAALHRRRVPPQGVARPGRDDPDLGRRPRVPGTTPSPYKRERLIDRLLAAPGYAWRMQDVFSVLLMERRDEVAGAVAAVDGVPPRRVSSA